jgi:hypothetical protein
MSTYADIQGTVRLDATAAASFSKSASWEWCEPAADPLGLVHHADDSLELQLNGGCYRNWCRYLLEDLFEAQQLGEVRGSVTIDCSDGGNWRTVARFDANTCKLGTVECYFEPVMGGPATMRTVKFARDHSMRFLTPQEESADSPLELLDGAAAISSCGCDGWDDELESPRCKRRPS